MTDPVRVRFAPSPTGYLHVGGARTALFNWLFARKHGGTFVLRMEDTDAERNTDLARRTIFEGLHRLGLDPDEGPEQGGPYGPYSQSERGEIYREVASGMLGRGGLYPCFCSRERLAALRAEQERCGQSLGYDQHCRNLSAEEIAQRIAAGESPTYRLKVPEGETVLEDLVRGRVVVKNKDIEDIILVRADGTPIYNMAVVIDDHTMRISHVLRGEDHLTNTFKQILLFQLMDWRVPVYAHLPLILGPSGEGKLSKRKHPEAAVEHYLKAGYDEEAFINWLALIGWTPGADSESEIFSREELIKRFEVSAISPAGARLPLDKLEFLSGHYLRALPEPEATARFARALTSAGIAADSPAIAERIRRLAPLVQARIAKWSDAYEQAAWALCPLSSYEDKAEKNLRKRPDAAEILRAYADSLPADVQDVAALEASARAFCDARELPFGQFVHPVRAALTGRAGGPPLFDCLSILGAEEAGQRLRAAAEFLQRG